MPLASLLRYFPSDSIPAGLAILSLAVTIGLAIGAIRIRGVRLGVAGVLFAALAFGQIGLSVDAKVLQFLRDFALILFMYTIGLQVGPGFVASLRAEGLRLNLLAVATLILGAILSWAIAPALPRATAPGVYAAHFLRDHPLLREHGIVFSRMLRDNLVTVPTADTKIQVGDIFRAVGPRPRLHHVISTMG